MFDVGVFGMLSGLIYMFGMYVDMVEFEVLCCVVVECGGYWVLYICSYGGGVFVVYWEVLDIGWCIGCFVYFMYVMMNFVLNCGCVDEFLVLIDEVIVDGVDVMFDMYFYLLGVMMLLVFLFSWFVVMGDLLCVVVVFDVDG